MDRIIYLFDMPVTTSSCCYDTSFSEQTPVAAGVLIIAIIVAMFVVVILVVVHDFCKGQGVMRPHLEQHGGRSSCEATASAPVA